MGAAIQNTPPWALPSIRLDIALYQEDDNCWVGHCIQLDLVGTSRKFREDALRLVLALCAEQVEYAVANNCLEYLFKPAPPEVLRKFLEGRLLTSGRLTENDNKHRLPLNPIEFQVVTF
jgi:hypothetical protein